MNMGEDNILLFARLDDLCSYADGGELKSSCFLSPRDLHFSRAHLERIGKKERYIEWGGYVDAERKKIFVLPEYMEDVTSYDELSRYGYNEDISAVKVQGSGYKKLSHRDFLGSVLGLGLKRDVVGDIIAKEDGAVIICEAAVADFICETLTKVGSDTVKVSKIVLDESFSAERRFQRITDTVPSARLDAIVASVCSLSRTRAKEIKACFIAILEQAVITK